MVAAVGTADAAAGTVVAVAAAVAVGKAAAAPDIAAAGVGFAEPVGNLEGSDAGRVLLGPQPVPRLDFLQVHVLLVPVWWRVQSMAQQVATTVLVLMGTVAKSGVQQLEAQQLEVRRYSEPMGPGWRALPRMVGRPVPRSPGPKYLAQKPRAQRTEVSRQVPRSTVPSSV